MRLLVSTSSALLDVRLVRSADGFATEAVVPVHAGMGIYYGLARHGRKVYAVARNRLHRSAPASDPAYAVECVLVFDLDRLGSIEGSISRAEWTDLHQVRHHAGLLWVISGRAPELRALAPHTTSLVGSVRLGDYVPPNLRHPPPPDWPDDPYHFNSLHFAAGRLFTLAHNWLDGSFCLEFDFPGAGAFLDRPSFRRAWTGLGTMSHDLLLGDERLVVLDSLGSAVVRTDGARSELRDDCGEKLFLRGLAPTEDLILVGGGEMQAERDRRLAGRSWLFVLDCKTLAPLARLSLGDYANPMDILLLEAET